MEEEILLLIVILLALVIVYIKFIKSDAPDNPKSVATSIEPYVYEDKELGFSFRYPKNWGIIDDDPDIKVAVVAPTKGGYIFSVKINVSIASAEPDLLNVSQKLLAIAYKSAFYNFKLLSAEKGKFAGEDCWIISFTVTEVGDDEKILLLQYLFNHGEYLYRVTISNLDTDFAKYDAPLKDIANSFVFK